MKPSRPSYLQLCPAEPFRIFFPLATLLGISGVSLWPLFFAGIHKFYPGVMHARLMIEGFLAGYVLGFLGTAMPRLLSAPALRGREVWPLVALHALCAGLQIAHQVVAGDLVFVTLLLAFAGCMVRRIHERTELPPPGFVLVGMGYLGGISGALLWVAGSLSWVSPRWMALGGMWLNQAFVLYLLLGVGTFLLPRFLGLPGIVLMDEERTASPGWRKRAFFALGAGVLVFASYWIEVMNTAPQFAAILRGVTVISFLAVMVPIHRTPSPWKTVPLAVNLALLSLVAGLIFPLFWPGQRVAGLHVVFLGGFSLITFTVGTRVVLGHSGFGHLFQGRLPALQVAAALIMVGTVLRAIGDFLMTRATWLNVASTLWMLAAIVWSVAVLPKVRHPDPDEFATCADRRAAAAAAAAAASH